MADSISLPEKSFPIISSDDGNTFDDVCSICLEPFNNNQDPPTVTNCKHEYHLQCILEWSQRSKECPICWQILALKDPASQELLAAVENERSLRSRIKVDHNYEDREVNHVSPYVDASEFDEHMLRDFAAVSNRLRHVNRRRRHRSSGAGPSQLHLLSPDGFQNLGHEHSQVNSEVSIPSAFAIDPMPPNAFPSVENSISNTTGTRDNTVGLSDFFQPQPPDSPPHTNSSESFSFPESIKSKFSAVSARYKDSITKGTRDFKEKLLARNSSVKELSREVHREMSAGIAGVARMIERLDLAAKRTGVSVPSSNTDGGTSNLMSKGKDVVHSNHENTGEKVDDTCSYPPQARPEISLQNQD